MKQKEKAIEYIEKWRHPRLKDRIFSITETIAIEIAIDIALKEQQKENKTIRKLLKMATDTCEQQLDELMESVKNVLEAIDESKRVDALFELKNLYKAILKRTK